MRDPLRACLYEPGLTVTRLSGMFFTPYLHEKNIPRLVGQVWLRRRIASKHACGRVCILKASPGGIVHIRKVWTSAPNWRVYMGNFLMKARLRPHLIAIEAWVDINRTTKPLMYLKKSQLMDRGVSLSEVQNYGMIYQPGRSKLPHYILLRKVYKNSLFFSCKLWFWKVVYRF